MIGFLGINLWSRLPSLSLPLYTYILRLPKQSSPIVKFDLYRNRNYAIANLMMFVLICIARFYRYASPVHAKFDGVYRPGCRTGNDARWLIIMALLPVVGNWRADSDPGS